MNKLLTLILFTLVSRANQIDVNNKNENLFKSLISCNLKKSKELLRDGASVTYIYPGKVFPGGLNIYQLSNYLNCFAKRGPSYQDKYKLKLQFIKNIQSLLMKYGAIDDYINVYLVLKESTPLEQKLYIAIENCNEEKIKDLIINKKVNPNLRFYFRNNYQGVTPYALSSMASCKTKITPQQNERELFLTTQKKSLLKLMISLGSNPNTLVPLTSFNGNIIKYIPSYWYAFYGDNDHTLNTKMKMILFSINIGADPNVYDNLGFSVLDEMDSLGGSYDNFSDLLSTNIDLLNKNIQGKLQYSLFPTWNLSYSENERIKEIFLNLKINYTKENFEHSLDNPLIRIIFDYLYVDEQKQRIGNDYSGKELMLFTKSLLKRHPQLISKESQKGVFPLKWMISMVCPISESNGIPNLYNGFFLDSEFNSKLNFDLLQKKENVYKWFLTFIRTMDISMENLNREDYEKNNLLDYALQFCPTEVVETLVKRGAIFSTNENNFYQHFQDGLKFIDASYTKSKIAFNNDYDNLRIYIEERNIDISALITRESKIQKLLYPNNRSHMIDLSASNNLKFKSVRIQKLLENKLVEWSLLSDFGIKNKKINISGFFYLEFVPVSSISPSEEYRLDLEKLQQEAVLLRERKTELSSDYNRFGSLSREIIEREMNKKNNHLRDEVRHIKKQKLFVSIDLISAQGLIKRKDFKEFSSLTSKTKKIWVSSQFICMDSYWCKWIEYVKKDGDLILKINIQKMKSETSTELFLINYFMGNEEVKNNMISQIKTSRYIEYSKVFLDLFFESPSSITQDSINVSIIETLFYLSSLYNINYNWKELYNKISKINLISSDSKIIFNTAKYLLGEDISIHTIVKMVLGNDNITHRFLTFTKLFKGKFLFREKLIDLIKTIIKFSDETKDNKNIKELKEIIFSENERSL